MATGTVKWFDATRGYGFLSVDGGGNDVFCHHSALEMDGFRELQQGQRVKFEVGAGKKGPQAEHVTVIG